jgi:hypothetical protein
MSRSYFLCNTSPRCAAECLVSTEIYEPIHKEFQARGLIGNEEHRVRMPVPCPDRTGADRPRPERYGAGASVLEDKKLNPFRRWSGGRVGIISGIPAWSSPLCRNFPRRQSDGCQMDRRPSTLFIESQ